MERVFFVSNRLSVTAERKKGVIAYTPSVGGLATGLSSVTVQHEAGWIGWCGMPSDELSPEEQAAMRETLAREHAGIPVFLSREDLRDYYDGFCNRTIWPLFHYFASYAEYDPALWEAYRRVNEAFLQKLREAAGPGDTVWIHDYQLLLLPRLAKEALPEARVGFFLHIPFPSFELFRLLPWRKQILEGMLGADLVGFHTYDYARHFLSSVRGLLGLEHERGFVRHDGRFTHVDVFPMGIDYDRFARAPGTRPVRRQIDAIRLQVSHLKVILSVDRLDYTKGIPGRLKAFDLFLKKYPRYREKVCLLLVVAPSRTQVSKYLALKREVDELVSVINGKYGTIGWVPILYFYRSMPFERLTALYSLSDVMLVTPIRDGMNLIAKEYIATHADLRGTLILSETAGAARELGEALIVNPNNVQEIADALKTALELPEELQQESNRIMHERLKRYDLRLWGKDFLEKLAQVIEYQKRFQVKSLAEDIHHMQEEYERAGERLIFLDYDGTLVPFTDRPERARPDEELIGILKALTMDAKNEVVLISGRGKGTMHLWFGGLQAGLVAGHGIWYRERGETWRLLEPPTSGEWKGVIRPILQRYTDRTPGSFVEEKDYSLTWHFRKADPELAFVRQNELKAVLREYISNYNLTILEGNKALEVKDININKGRGAYLWLSRKRYDFILAFGDDLTDEDLFAKLPESAYSVKVGYGASIARYFVESPLQVRGILKRLSASRRAILDYPAGGGAAPIPLPDSRLAGRGG